MKIQINTVKTLIGDIKMQEYTSTVKESLIKYQSNITRIEIHLKGGLNDMSCELAARLKSRKLIAITSQAATMEFALSDAIGKIDTALKTIIG